MTRKKKLNLNDRDDVEIRYSNWLAQLCALIMSKIFVLVAGRASTKTTDFTVERLQEAVYDCPGAPFVWASDTYANLHKNVIPSLLEGLKLKGWEEGVHFVINKEPPKEWKDKMFNMLSSWKNTMIFFTGFNLTFVSLDRPSIGAGRSYVGIFGDETKYFKESTFANLLKAVRGYRVKYGNSPFYRSRTLTTDMPNPNSIGEYDWVLKYSKLNNKESILLCLKTGIIYNETKKEYAAAIESGNEKKIALAEKNMLRWEERWKKVRSQTSFFWIASSFINVDILSLEWFMDELSVGLEGIATNILSIIPKLSASSRFYAGLEARHFYADGNDNTYLDTLPYGANPDCRILKYLNRDRPIEAGLDIGKTLWMVFGQPDIRKYRVLKEMHTLPPRYIRQLADDFLEYFKPQRRKTLKLYYDRAANNMKKVGQDVASQIKQAIEYDAEGKRTGWTVQLMSLGQGNIGQNAEYNFMMQMMSGNNKLLPQLLIDRHNCPYLKTQMENTPAKEATSKSLKGMIVKEKKGDNLPDHRLPKESTNYTDAFKYLLMRKAYVKLLRKTRSSID